MSDQPMREVVVHATIDDAYDGVIRLLGDAQRFGFGLRAFNLVTGADGVAVAAITLSVPARIDAHFLAARLARHPTMRSVAAGAHREEVGLDQPRAAA
jgi:hypothetical protein